MKNYSKIWRTILEGINNSNGNYMPSGSCTFNFVNKSPAQQRKNKFGENINDRFGYSEIEI